MSENMNFTVYSKDGCPYCSKVVQVLKLSGLKHVVYKLDDHFDKKSFLTEIIMPLINKIYPKLLKT